jgi:transposase-like protein
MSEGKTNEYQPRRHYYEDYKRRAVELTLQGKRSVRQVAEELGVKVSVLYEWRHRLAPRPGVETRAPRTLEEATAVITRLRTELGRMHERENMLKNRWTSPPKRQGAGCSGRGH